MVHMNSGLNAATCSKVLFFLLHKKQFIKPPSLEALHVVTWGPPREVRGRCTGRRGEGGQAGCGSVECKNAFGKPLGRYLYTGVHVCNNTLAHFEYNYSDWCMVLSDSCWLVSFANSGPFWDVCFVRAQTLICSLHCPQHMVPGMLLSFNAYLVMKWKLADS